MWVDPVEDQPTVGDLLGPGESDHPDDSLGANGVLVVWALATTVSTVRVRHPPPHATRDALSRIAEKLTREQDGV